MSYRDTFRLLFPYVAQLLIKPIDRLQVTDITDRHIHQFLLYIEEYRNCSTVTINQRLAAIHAFSKFIGLYCPEYIEWSRQIRLVPFKKTQKNLVTYLEKVEMDTLLEEPDQSTAIGKRDHALLLFLYNTGARVSEAAQLKIDDLDIAENRSNFASVVIHGKGKKIRQCPLWQNTVLKLTPLIQNKGPSESVFLNRRSQPITRFGIHNLVKRYVKQATLKIPELKKKKVSPHTIRHTTATHLLRAGVDINTIRAWLGHVSISTTNIYAEVDLEMKANALAYCEIKGEKQTKNWNNDDKLISFLNNL